MWAGILILFDITEPPGSGDLSFTGYQSAICFRKVPIARWKFYRMATCLHAPFCDANGTLLSFGLHFNLVVVFFVFCDRKFLSILNQREKNRAAGVKQHGKTKAP